MLSKFLDPKNDVAFKKIFGTEKNQDILIHFLNDMLVFKDKNPISSVTFLKTIQDPDIASQKMSIVDILCEDEKGSKYIVEMQVASTSGFEKRAQYYASKTYSSQAAIGENYADLKEVIFLAIADYVVFPKKQAYKSDHVILDKMTYAHDLKDFSFTFVELPKFTKTLDELSTLQEKWCYFFKHAGETAEEDLKKIIGNDEIIRKVYGELNRFYWTKEELAAYEQMEKRTNDHLSMLKKKTEEGIEIGRAEERAKDEQEKAELQAKAELEKNLIIKDMARSLLKQNLPIAFIEGVTKLSREEIASL